MKYDEFTPLERAYLNAMLGFYGDNDMRVFERVYFDWLCEQVLALINKPREFFFEI